MKNTTSTTGELRCVEILHVDTSGSRELHSKLEPREKSESEDLFKQFFKRICNQAGKVLRIKWSGDGGFAIFASSKEKELEATIRAGENFLAELPFLNVQTADALQLPSFPRRVRIKAHRGEVYIAPDKDVDSALSKNFDDFLKFEKKFAPEDDELFITDALYEVLAQESKKRFELYAKTVVAGSLRSRLRRLKRTPVASLPRYFRKGGQSL